MSATKALFFHCSIVLRLPQVGGVNSIWGAWIAQQCEHSAVFRKKPVYIAQPVLALWGSQVCLRPVRGSGLRWDPRPRNQQNQLKNLDPGPRVRRVEAAENAPLTPRNSRPRSHRRRRRRRHHHHRRRRRRRRRRRHRHRRRPQHHHHYHQQHHCRPLPLAHTFPHTSTSTLTVTLNLILTFVPNHTLTLTPTVASFGALNL